MIDRGHQRGRQTPRSDAMRRPANLPRWALLTASVLLLVAPASPACRYSVRDTGFVDLDQPPWRLRLETPSVPAREAWPKAANRLTIDTNLRLALAEGGDAANARPGLVAVGPDDRTLPLSVPSDLVVAEKPDAARLAALIDSLALSPLRDRLHGELLQAFAVLVFIEGTQPGPTAQARRTAEDAIRAFTPLLRSLPKPVEIPPKLVAVTPTELENERLFVWSLGTSPDAQPEPRLAVLYGRGRRIGEVLEGPLITRTKIAERLSLIGQDCECDLDRAWLQGPVFPARWDSARQTAAARALGFDPENPLVRSEVSRIVLRGPLPGQARRPVARTGFDGLALGYREESLDDVAQAENESETETVVPASATNVVDRASAPGPGITPASDAAAPTDPPPGVSWPWITLAGVIATTLTTGGILLLRHLRSR